MLVKVESVLSREEVAHCRAILDGTTWVDGKVTAGAQSALAKKNLQVPEDAPQARQLGADGRPHGAVGRPFQFPAQGVQFGLVQVGGAALHAVEQAARRIGIGGGQRLVQLAQARRQVGHEGVAQREHAGERLVRGRGGIRPERVWRAGRGRYR